MLCAAGLAGPVAAAAPRLPGLTPTLPAAALAHEPRLPVPAGWSGSEAFPRTSGTSRLDRGSLLWTDYLYDDHGAAGAPGANPDETGVPSYGGYTYDRPEAHGNGADVFRAAVELQRDATVWRVDWNTLADPSVPLAIWALDTDRDAGTGGSAWPAGAGVRSPGVDRFLVVSARGAALLDGGGRRLLALPTRVDLAARSFLVQVPRRALPATGTWRVRLGAGVADAAGTALARPGGALPGQPALYQVAFRTAEPVALNFWNDNQQSQALSTADVSGFGLDLPWAELARHRSTPERTRPGWNVRWYVSSVELGPGRRTSPAALQDRQPDYLGRVQPYSVYVPTTYRAGRPAPLTLLLHSLTQNHNQYAATTPRFTEQACERRGSLCVTTLGRGPDGFYQGAALRDLWEVWARVHQAYAVDPDRTVVAGYSMGGFAANQLSQRHPDLFAAAVSLAGATGQTPELDNLREVPVYLGHGAADELVPVRQAIAQADRLDALGLRYRFLLHPAADHVAYELQDGFSDAAAWMGSRRRSRSPRGVTYTWLPSDEQVAGTPYGVTGAYWVHDLHGRDPQRRARVEASSGALPGRTPVPRRRTGLVVPGDPSPGVVRELTWAPGAPVSRQPVLRLDLRGVASLAVDLRAAGLAGRSYRLEAVSDGRTAVRLVAGSRERQLVVSGRLIRTLGQ